MSLPPPSTRRDPRYRLPLGSFSVEFTDPRADGARGAGAGVAMSAAGLAFQLDGQAEEFPSGTCLGALTVCIGDCLLAGEAVVRNTREVEPGRVEVGCLFYPDPAEEDRWMTLIAGIEVAAPSGGDGQ